MTERKVLLVGWDGADWKIARPLLQSGKLPQLALALKNGASGPIASLPPYLSPMLWNSMATGKRPHRHGILGFTQVNPRTGKVQPVSSHMRRCPAFWNILSEKNLPNHVIGWFASHPAESVRGVCVSEAFIRPPKHANQDWPIPRNSVAPSEWADRLGETRVRPEEIDQGLLRLFLPFIDEMDLERDSRANQILYRLAELYTAHNAAVTLLANDDSWRCLAVYYHFIDWISHEFMEFRPPQRPGVLEEEVRFYGSVVDAAYQVQDFLLTDLLRHAGPGVTLLLASDHGFQSDHLRPEQTPDVTAGIADWHRPHGMLVIAGPDMAAGHEIEGASILDIAPTLLHLLDLPVGKDMDGRALFEVMKNPTPPATVPSWDTALQGWRRTHDLTLELDVNEDTLLQQFVDLGYVEMPSNPQEDLVEMTARETSFNLGISLLAAGAAGDALPHLWEAHAQCPEQPHYAYHLARALAALGLGPEAEEVIEVLRDFGEDHPIGRSLRGQIALQSGNHEAAAIHFEVAGGTGRNDVVLQGQRGLIALQENRFADAEACFRAALEIDDDHALAWLGLARSLSRQDQYPQAADAARRALALQRDLPIAHLTLAQSLEAAGESDAAAEAYAEALRLEPNLQNSRSGLLRLHPTASKATQDRVLEHLSRAKQKPAQKKISPAQALIKFHTLKQQHRANQSERRNELEPVESYDFRTPTSVAAGASGKVFYLVSGLPRSGTSMMMQILEKGGLAPMTDGQRLADPDNPRGYYEWEAMKRLAQQPDIIEKTSGLAVKVISALLEYLPRKHQYRIIFMRRPVDEIAKSQQAMLDRLQKSGAGDRLNEIAAALLQHETATLNALRLRPEIHLLELAYSDVLRDPQSIANQLQTFLGSERLPKANEMIQAIDPTLYRQRLPK